MNRNEIVKRANEAGQLSNRGGAPTLAPDSDGPTVVEWLQWADPNGIHTWHDACGSRDCEYCGRRGEPHYPADGDPWGAVAEMLADTLPCCPACESDEGFGGCIMKTDIRPDALYWWTESMGRFDLKIPGQAILDIFRPGPADGPVAHWAEIIERPVRATADALRASLKEYGAWDDEELSDDATNWERVVWSACCDLGDSPEDLEEAT